jgi:hypothetical protein
MRITLCLFGTSCRCISKGSGSLREDRTAIGCRDTDINIDIGESDVSTRREHQEGEVWSHRTGEKETKQPVRP